MRDISTYTLKLILKKKCNKSLIFRIKKNVDMLMLNAQQIIQDAHEISLQIQIFIFIFYEKLKLILLYTLGFILKILLTLTNRFVLSILDNILKNQNMRYKTGLHFKKNPMCFSIYRNKINYSNSKSK